MRVSSTIKNAEKPLFSGYIGIYEVSLEQEKINDNILPKLRIIFGPYKIAASRMSMPKASIYKDYGFILGQNDVWLARKPGDVLSVTETLCKQIFAYKLFRFGILSPNTGHIIASSFW